MRVQKDDGGAQVQEKILKKYKMSQSAIAEEDLSKSFSKVSNYT